MTASLQGHRVVAGRVYLPAWGVPWAEVSLDAEVILTGRASLTVADLALSVTIMSGGTNAPGRSSYRLAAGAGGWGRTLPPKSYYNDAGVKTTTVLADAASACGETLDQTTLPSARLGPAWTREDGPAARILELIAPANWYVGEDGITRLGRRLPRTVTLPAEVLGIDRARQIVIVAAESIAMLGPGATVDGIEAVDVMHEILPNAKLRTTIWGAGPSQTDRALAALRRLFDQLDPDRNFRGVYEYRIVTQDILGRLDLQPIRVSTGLPDLSRVSVRPGMQGEKATHALGSRVLVGFVDASPSRPVVVAFEESSSDGFSPLVWEVNASGTINIGKGATLPAARLTDKVICGGFAGTIVAGSAKTRIA